MTMLSNFPMVNQNTAITEDGLPNKDAPFECVSASLLAAVMWLLGVSQVGGKYTPDYFKDQVYGESYMGGTAASAYIAFLAQQFGVRLYSFSANNWDLVAQAHKELQAGHPVVFTIPDTYVSASLNWSHVCVWYAEDTGYLTALDPYIGKPVRRTDDEWAKLLLDNQIWILERMSDEVPKPFK